MTGPAGIRGHSYQPTVLEDVRRRGLRAPAVMLLDTAIAVDGGDRYLSGSDLEAARRALIDAGEVQIGFGTYSSLRNLYRDVKDRLGDPLPYAPPNVVGVPIAGFGRVGEDVVVSALLPKTKDGKPDYPLGNQIAPVYIEHWQRNQEPQWFGPFNMTAEGLLATPEALRSLASEKEIDFETLRYMFGPTRLGSGADFFGPIPVDSASSRNVQRTVFPELFNGESVRVLDRKSGQTAISTMLERAYGASEHERLMRHVLKELMRSGAIKNVQYYRVEAGIQPVASAHALVLIDRTGRAAAFKVGTL